jgi:hypothetical protein
MNKFDKYLVVYIFSNFDDDEERLLTRKKVWANY